MSRGLRGRPQSEPCLVYNPNASDRGRLANTRAQIFIKSCSSNLAFVPRTEQNV